MKLFPPASTLVTAPSTIQKLAIRLLGTAPPSKTPLRLVTGDHCTLCVHFKKQLDFYLTKSNRIAEFDITEVDIKSDENLKEVGVQIRHPSPAVQRQNRPQTSLLLDPVRAISTTEAVRIMIAAHGGVGSVQGGVDRVCAEALRQWPRNALQATVHLEISALVNCGYGSSLTASGKIEVEAGFMSSNKMAFGAAGAVSNTKHPVLIAKHLATRFQNEDNFHLVPPQVIVGSGADALAVELGIPIVSNDELKSPQAVQMYEIARSRLHALEEAATEADDPSLEPSDVPMDTVGCAFVSDTGPAEATVSSGGMLLKADGRLGHSTQFGSAIWAEQRGRRSIAISVSGCGEVLTRTHFAQALAEAVFKASEDDMLPSAITSFYHKFINSPTIAAFPAHRRVVGGILIFKIGRTCELAAFHNNARFAFAFHNGKSVKHFISELSANAPFVCNSFVVNL